MRDVFIHFVYPICYLLCLCAHILEVWLTDIKGLTSEYHHPYEAIVILAGNTSPNFNFFRI